MNVQTQVSAKPSLTLKRRINAAPAKVYAAWTDPLKMAQWLGPHGTVGTSAETDVRVGGRFQIQLRMEDGQEHNASGVYREVVPDEKLVFTWSWRSTPERESLVTLTFKPDGAGTLFTLHHEQFFDEEARDSHKQGWTGALDKLVKYFE